MPASWRPDLPGSGRRDAAPIRSRRAPGGPRRRGRALSLAWLRVQRAHRRLSLHWRRFAASHRSCCDTRRAIVRERQPGAGDRGSGGAELMETATIPQRPVGASALAGQIVDCDVHPVVKGGIETVFPYMPAAWRHRIETKGASVGISALSPRTAVPHGGSAVRVDAQPPEGGPGGSSRSWMLQQLVAEQGIGCAVLNCLQPGALAVALAGPDESAILCSAFNDYFLEEWSLAA